MVLVSGASAVSVEPSVVDRLKPNHSEAYACQAVVGAPVNE